MYAEHYAAGKDRLEEHVGLAEKVFDVVRRNKDGEYIRANYVVLSLGMPETGGDRQARAQVHEDNAIFDYKARVVGITPDAVMSILNDISQQWLGWVPTVPGRRCSTMRYPRQTVEILPDYSVRPPLFYADVEYTLTSNFLSRSGS